MIDLANFFHIIRQRLPWILGITLLVVLATFLITRMMPRRYESTARLSTGLTERLDLGSEQTYYQSDKVENEFQNLLERLTSRAVVSLLSYQLVRHDLGSAQPFANLSGVRGEYDARNLERAKSVYRTKYDRMEPLFENQQSDELALDLLDDLNYDYEGILKRLGVWRQSRSDYIQIRFRSDDPQLSAFAVNTLAEEFIRHYRSERGLGGDEEVEEMRRQMEERKRFMEEKQVALNQIRAQYNLVGSAQEGQSAVEAQYDSESMRNQLLREIGALEAEIDDIDKKLNNQELFRGMSRGEDNPELVQLTRQISNLRTSISLGNAGPGAQDSLDNLRSRRQALLAEANRGVSANPSEILNNLTARKIQKEERLQGARRELEQAERVYRRASGRKGHVARGVSAVTQAETEYELAMNDYNQAVREFNTASNKAGVLGDNLRVVERGVPADEPERSKAASIIVFSGLASLSLCIVVLFMLEYVDNSIKTPSNFLRLTQLPLLGALNKLETPSLQLDALFGTRHRDPTMERYKQELRKLRYEIAATGAKKILFTSVNSGVGKTLSLVSLAYSLSLNNKKVLLIDSNLKDPTLTTMLGAPPTLEKWMQEPGQDPQQAVARSEFDNIDVIGSRGGEYSPSEVLYDDAFQRMLDNLSQDYDFIFMEGSALSDYADSKELIQFVEKVVVVFSGEEVLTAADRETILYLRELDDKLLGAILNNVDIENTEF